jgi:hypothetical protein
MRTPRAGIDLAASRQFVEAATRAVVEAIRANDSEVAPMTNPADQSAGTPGARDPLSEGKAGKEDERIYPCDDCGVMRSKNEGGTTFTVCDDCWDAHYRKAGAND